ncbi:MAG: CotH kinase family protein, partial [Leadbetterella sp.]
IVKVDKSTGSNPAGSVLSEYVNKNNKRYYYFFHDPKDPTAAQKAYMTNYIKQFENAIYKGLSTDLKNGYRNYVDVASFAKLLLLNEVSGNVDGYRISTFFYKDKDSKNSKLTAGPPWDYDITFGNADYCQKNNYNLWSYKFNDICPNDGFPAPEYWVKMVSDPYFLNLVGEIYHSERKPGGIFSNTRLEEVIDGYARELADAQVRNFNRWKTLGTYVWPNPSPIAPSWQGEVNELRNWLSNRLDWMDVNIPRPQVITYSEPNKSPIKLTVFPNPFIDKVHLEIENGEEETAKIIVQDAIGKTFSTSDWQLVSGINKTQISLDKVEAGKLIFIRIIKSNGKTHFQKLIKL